MHYLMYVAVECDEITDDTDAENAIGGLETYQGVLYDYYSVGGRWSDILEGGNFLRVADHREVVLALLARVNSYQLAEINQGLRRVYGEPEPVPAPGEPGPFGFSLPDPEGYAQRVTADNVQTHESLRRLLTCPADEWSPSEDMSGLIGHQLHNTGNLLAGYPTSSSNFLDLTHGWTYVSGIQKAIQEEDDADLWLVTVDLHN